MAAGSDTAQRNHLQASRPESPKNVQAMPARVQMRISLERMPEVCNLILAERIG